MDRFLKATGIGSKRNVTSPTVKSPPSKSPSTKQLKQVQIDSDSDESENETRTTISDKNKLKKNNNNISSNNINNNNNNNNNNQTMNSPNLKPQLSNKSILSNSDTKSIKSNITTNNNTNNSENDVDRQLKQLSTPVRNNNNNNNQINNRNDVKELKQTLSEKSIILEPQQSQSQPKIETEFKYESEKSVTNSSNNSIIIPNDPNHKLPVIIPAPIIVQNDNYKFEEKITQLEREVEQLKIQKKNLEKSIEHEKLSNHNFQKVIEENKLVIKKLESRVSELTQEEEEMRAELFSKYDEIHALEDSKNRLNAQYLETAKQLRNLETEAVNRKNLTSSNNSIPIIPLPPPPPEPQLQQQNNITNSKQLNSIQSDEMRELRHQLKENEEKLKFQKSLTESKQLMNMKLDGRNRELMEQNDHFKSLIANYRQEIHDKEKEINELNSKISHLNERFNGPHNIDKKKILELENENQKLSEKIIENDKIFEVKEEKARIQLVDAKAEVEFMRKLLTECESEIEVLEGILENESSEMTQILSYMKTNNEGLFRFLQSIICHYQSNEKLLNNNNNNEINENINNDNNSGIDEKNLDINGSETITSLNQNDDNNNNVKTSISSTNISSTSILDIQDVIYLLDSGILTLKVKPGHRPLHQMLSNLKSNNKNEENITKNHSSPSKRKVNGIDSTLPSRPPPVSAGGKISLECTLHLLDFMDKYQLAGLSKHFKNIVEDTQSNNSISTEGTPQPFQKSPMKLGSSHNTRLSSSTLRKPPVMNTPYFESDNISSATQSTNQSSTVKGPEYVCFTINRGNGLPDEKWLEIVDSSTKLKYYFNPQTGITQWELPINTKSK